MEKIIFAGVEVNRCTDCQGLFLDALAKEVLQKARGADAIDIGDEKVGKEFNKVDRIICPNCGTLMIRMVDLEQHHIWFEHCTVCGGAFFDAGEFRDLKHHTLADLFRDWLTGRRP